MKPPTITTKAVAEATGVHPNTVRKYEEWGFLPDIPRSGSGYRLYTEVHVEQMRLARLVLHGQWPGRAIRQSALELVRLAATGDLEASLEKAHSHLALVQTERAKAETAANILEQWAAGIQLETGEPVGSISEVAKKLDITVDALRNWERNGLITIPRNPSNGYRLYGSQELNRLQIIRLLTLAGYSQAAIFRMLRHLDQGLNTRLKETLDTPDPEEDVYTAADRWLTELTGQEQRALDIIRQVEYMLGQV